MHDGTRIDHNVTNPYVKQPKSNYNLLEDLLLVAKRVIAEHDADWDMPQELLEMARRAVSRAEDI